MKRFASLVARPCAALVLSAALAGCPQSGGGAPTPKGVDTSANNALGAGARAKIRTTMQGIQKACTSYNAKKGEWPTSMDDLVTEGIWQEGQRADPWGNDYLIEIEGSTVRVSTLGADGEEGGEGRDTDFTVE
ncbi:MAG TPA: hypothetical protein DEA08_26790 [Planctomycetes bacterium]|nr:hypothetical protein [Planctomycetota bacterium]